MSNKLEPKILALIGRLALAKSIAKNAQIELIDLLDNHSLKRVTYDENTLCNIRGTIHNLDYVETTIDGAIYDISVETFNQTDDATTDHD